MSIDSPGGSAARVTNTLRRRLDTNLTIRKHN